MAEFPEKSDAEATAKRVARGASLTPSWETLDPRNGLPTWEALFHFVDRERAVRLYDYAARQTHEDFSIEPTGQWRQPRFSMLSSFGPVVFKALIEKLRSGELQARGFSSTAALDAPRQDIHRDRWGDLVLDVRASRAEVPGIVISQILVFANGP